MYGGTLNQGVELRFLGDNNFKLLRFVDAPKEQSANVKSVGRPKEAKDEKGSLKMPSKAWTWCLGNGEAAAGACVARRIEKNLLLPLKKTFLIVT